MWCGYSGQFYKTTFTLVNGLNIINYIPFICIGAVYIHSFNGNAPDKCQISGINCPNSTIRLLEQN